MSKLDWVTQEIAGLKEQGLYNRIRTIGSPQGAWLTDDKLLHTNQITLV